MSMMINAASALGAAAALSLSFVAQGGVSAPSGSPAPAPAAPAATAATSSVTIDPSVHFQTIDGYGVSLINEPKSVNNLVPDVGSLTPAQQSQVMNLLFGRSGADMNILRIELGAGETYPLYGPVPNFTIEPNAPASPDATPSYVWDGSADGDVQLAQMAQRLGARIYADAWSAPAYMKTNDNVYNGGELCGLSTTCASGDWTQAYANYLAQYVKDYESSGVKIDYLSPYNEPDLTTDYQSMTASPADIASFVATLGATFKADGITTKIASGEVTNANDNAEYQQAIQADPAAAAAQSIDSFHAYEGVPAADPTALLAGKPSWQTEFTCVGGTWNTAYSTGDCDGEYWATTMYNAMNNGVSAYMGWTGAWCHTDNEDLIQISLPNANGISTYAVSSRLWVMGNYARYVHPGAVRIEADSDDSSLLTTGYRNTDGNYVLVATNTSSSDLTFQANGLTGGTVTPVVTSDTQDLAAGTPEHVTSGMSLTAPAHSTVTYVFAGATHPSPPSQPADGRQVRAQQYELLNLNSGSALTVDTSDTGDGGAVWQYQDENEPAQHWILRRLANGYYEIYSSLTGEALSVDGASQDEGATVYQWHWEDSPSQEWKLDSTSSVSGDSGALMIVNKNSGLVLSISGAGTTNEEPTNQWAWLGTTNAELWTLEPVS